MPEGLRFGSVCSGIGAPEIAWRDLPWRCAFQSEIDKFPCAVLKQRFPGVPLHGDFTTIEAGDYEPIDLLVGGTPCQSFSLAGLRGGLADDRGNLALEYIRLAGRLRPRWLVWENVAGVLSSASHDAPDPCEPGIAVEGQQTDCEVETSDDYNSEESHALNCFLAGLSEVGYGFAYRVFDAQFAGVPQRRRRIFLVGYLGDWRPAAAVLIEPESLQGHPAPRREARAVAAALSANGAGVSGADDNQAQGGHLIAGMTGYFGDYREGHNPVIKARGGDSGHGSEALVYGGNNCSGPIDVAPAVNAHGGPHGRLDFESEALVTHTLRGEGFDASEDGTGRGTPIVAQHPGVRRLTPVECERLQGLPDNWTAIEWRRRKIPEDEARYYHGHGLKVWREGADWFTSVAPDGPRYQGIGNSMDLPDIQWIGERIEQVEGLI